MTEQITAELWSRPGGGVPWERTGIVVTATEAVLHDISDRYRAASWYEDAEYWEFEFREVPKPIVSFNNSVLQHFRGSINALIGPNICQEASWWLQLIQWDPHMEREDYWGEELAYRATHQEITDAVRVLSRIRNLAK